MFAGIFTKKRVIVAGCFILLCGIVIAAILLVNYFTGWREVTFRLAPTVESATVYRNYDSDTQKEITVAELTEETSPLRLRDGLYQVVPSGATIDQTAINITIDAASREIVIAPNLSAEFLAQQSADGQDIETAVTDENDNLSIVQIPTDLATIQGVISAKYPDIIADYEIGSGRFMGDGSWYATTLQKTVDARSPASDVYRTILHFNQADQAWQIAAGPALVLGYGDYPDIPKVVISGANALE